MCHPTHDDVAFESARRKRPASRQQQQQRRRRAVNPIEDDGPAHVTFQDSSSLCQVRVIPTALSCLLEQGGSGDKKELWYQRTDVQEFRRRAQVITKRLRVNPSFSSGDGGDNGDDNISDGDYETRGLEVRMSLHRQDRKQMMARRIVEAQAQDATPEEMAHLASAGSVWPQKLAVAQAHQDYCAVYRPDLLSLSSSSPTAAAFSALPAMPLALNCGQELLRRNKRSLLGTSSSLEQTGRRVRCRMY